MRTFTIYDEPIKVFGIANFEKTKKLTRLPDDVIEKVPSLDFLGRRPVGARVAFRTNSTAFKVKIVFETLSEDIGMSIYACQSAFVFAGERSKSVFLGIVSPPNYQTKEFEKEFTKNDKIEDITILLPRNEIVSSVEISINDDALIEAPTPYKYSKPIIYYGSSITEGGCSCNPSSAYNAIISRHLDVDYYNFGFSGNCKGEPQMADFFNTLDFSIFVLDYDHNAPTVEHLMATHEPFYKMIREKNPTVPIVMLTRPRPQLTDDEEKRRQVVENTYKNAIQNGDKNVYYISGPSMFEGFPDAELCFIDGTHPNDLGFYKMAEATEPLIRALLEGTVKK